MTTQSSPLPRPARKAPSRKPIVIKRGSVSVAIYTDTPIAGSTYQRFTLVWREPGGTRKRRGFADLEEAQREGEVIATRLANGQTDILKLSNSDVAELQQAREILAPFKLSVPIAAHKLTEALQRLPLGADLLEAVDFYAKRHPSNAPKRTVAEVVAELIADRTSAKCSRVYLRDLAIRLNRFAGAFAIPIASIDPAAVRTYIQNLTHGRSKNGKPSSPRSRRNTLKLIRTLFTFARKAKYVPRELDEEIGEIDPPHLEPTEIGIFSPSEIARLLEGASPELIPPIAIGAFAGLRHAELSRLDWSEINLRDRFIVLRSAKAKTAARRVIPISENLAAWLQPRWKAAGPINPAEDEDDLGKRLKRVADRVKLRWQRNGLRHSFISYRTALIKNVPQVALECGNSPAMIFRNYREVVREEDSKAWFSVRPPTSAENIVTLPTAATA